MVTKPVEEDQIVQEIFIEASPETVFSTIQLRKISLHSNSCRFKS